MIGGSPQVELWNGRRNIFALTPDLPKGRIGHVHLKVADLDRALAFYRDVLGFELTQRYDGASDHGVSEGLYLRDPDGNGGVTLGST